MSLKNCRSGDRIEPPGYCFLFVNPGGDFIGWQEQGKTAILKTMFWNLRGGFSNEMIDKTGDSGYIYRLQRSYQRSV